MHGGRLVAGGQSHQLQVSQAGPAASVICKLEAPASELRHDVWASNKQKHCAHMHASDHDTQHVLLGKLADKTTAIHLHSHVFRLVHEEQGV